MKRRGERGERKEAKVQNRERKGSGGREERKEVMREIIIERWRWKLERTEMTGYGRKHVSSVTYE